MASRDSWSQLSPLHCSVVGGRSDIVQRSGSTFCPVIRFTHSTSRFLIPYKISFTFQITIIFASFFSIVVYYNKPELYHWKATKSVSWTSLIHLFYPYSCDLMIGHSVAKINWLKQINLRQNSKIVITNKCWSRVNIRVNKRVIPFIIYKRTMYYRRLTEKANRTCIT